MREMKLQRLTVIAVALLLLCAGTAFGQVQSGNLFGTAMDDGGSALPGVTVTVTGGGAPQVQVTGTDGQFRFVGLSPGSYTLTASLDGFSTVENPNIVINVNRNTTVNVELSAAIEETIVVTSESPLLDERKVAVGTTISQTELEKIPTSRDPWAILQSVPGVQTDRINVGGNESGQQSNFTGPGSSGDDGVWAIDGVEITDMGAIGSSPTYYNFDAFQEMQVSTGGSDASASSSGVTMNMVTKRGTNEWRGSGRYMNSDEGRQDSLDFDQSDLGQDFDGDGPVGAQGDFSQGNRIVEVLDFGVEFGGPVVKDKLWIWANYGEQEVDLLTIDNVSDLTQLETYGAKLNAQVTTSNSLVAFYNYGDKIKIGRNASPTRPQPTTWNQTGPTDIYKLEDTHIFNSSFYLTGMVSYVGGGFQLTPQGGLDGVSPILDADFIWQSNFLHHETDRPQEQAKLDGNYFFNSGSVNHELKFGVRYRSVELTSLSVWPGDVLRLDYYQSFGYEYNVAQVTRPRFGAADTEYTSIYAQDTLTVGNLTANIGLRYDEQDGSIPELSVRSVPGFETLPDGTPLLPAASAAPRDQGFGWDEIMPRLGLTYAMGEDRSTLLRASFSQFSEQLAQGNTQQTATIGYSYAYFYYDDTNGDGFVTSDEIINFEDGPAFTNGYDPNGQTTFARVNADYTPNLTSELVLGVEHALLPEFVVGATLTLRERDDFAEFDRIICDANEQNCRGDQASDYVQVRTDTVTRPDGSTFSVPVWGLADGLTNPGGSLLQTGERSQNYEGITVSINKRLSNRWMLRANATISDWEWDVPNGAVNEPNLYLGGAQADGGPVLEGSGTGSGSKGGVYISSNWSYSITGLYQVAPDRSWGFNLAAAINGREGYAVPYYTRFGGNGIGLDGQIRLQATSEADEFRLDDVNVVDLRVEKDFTFNDFGFTLSAEVFNAFNESTVLQREHRLGRSNTNHVREILSPRVVRLGVRLNFR